MAYDTEDYWYDLHEKDLTPLQLEIYKCIGYESFELLVYNFGGQSIRIPSKDRLTKKEKYQAISHDRHTSKLTLRQIMDKYRVSKDVIEAAVKKYPEPPTKIEPFGMDDLSEYELKIVNCIGFDSFMKLIDCFSGMRIHIPSISGYAKKIRHREIVEACQGKKLTPEQISEDHGVGRRYIVFLCRDEETIRQEKLQKSRIARRNKRIIKDHFDNSLTYEKLGEKYGLSIGRIEAIIQASERYKRTKAASKQALKTRNEQVMQDYAAGLTYREIGEKYGISKDCVATIIYRERKKSKE